MDKAALIHRTEEAHKTYKFNEKHNPRIPADYWFQHTIEGETLFIVFYTQACRYSKCEGCNLPSLMSLEHVNFKHIMKQVDMIFNNILSTAEKQSLKKIIVSNNGSVLDQDTFSTTALIYLISKINLECPHVKTVTLETRPEYVELDELEVIVRALREGDSCSSLELAIGFEVHDSTIRNEVFKKGLTFEKFEEFVSIVSNINKKYLDTKLPEYIPIKLKTYFMLKPVPEFLESVAIADIHQGIDYLHSLANKYSIDINMHLNPTYVAAGTPLEEDFNKGMYKPPLLSSVVYAVKHAEHKSITVYVGLNDENLTVPGGSFIREGNAEDAELLKILEQFNHDQDYRQLHIRSKKVINKGFNA